MVIGPKTVDPTKVLLVNPTTDSGEAAASASCYPPLGLISIGTVLKREIPETQVSILDQAVVGTESITAGFSSGAVVGISALTTTYRNALRLAEEAIEKHCFVIMGNDHAGRFAEKIVCERGVHAVLIGDHTEFPFAGLMRWLASKRDFVPDIPGLAMRGPFGPVAQPPLKYSMENLPVPDRSLVDHRPYRETFVTRFGPVLSTQDLVPTTVNLCRGCSKHNDRCSFCDIYDLSLDRVSPRRAWKELMSLTGCGFNYLWEVGDSFTSHPHWLKEIANLRPADFKGELFVYARAQELTKLDAVDILQKIGVTRVNIGMESGDDEGLKIFNKGNLKGSETNRLAAKNLKEKNIRAHVSLILGFPGETRDSLARTEEMVGFLLGLGVLSSIDVAVLYPLPGAPLWQMLKNHTGFEDALGTDLLPRDLRERFIRYFCRATMDEIFDSQSRINRMAVAHGCVPGGFG